MIIKIFKIEKEINSKKFKFYYFEVNILEISNFSIIQNSPTLISTNPTCLSKD